MLHSPTSFFENIITPYKNRSVDPSKPVWIYRNLAAKCDGDRFSVMQGRLVVGHTNSLLLRDCEFVVNEKIRQKVVATQRKKVHAFLKGMIYEDGKDELIRKIKKNNMTLPARIHYNPYYSGDFFWNEPGREQPVNFATYVMIADKQISAAYILYHVPLEEIL